MNLTTKMPPVIFTGGILYYKAYFFFFALFVFGAAFLATFFTAFFAMTFFADFATFFPFGDDVGAYLNATCAAASLAIGTRNGEQET